MKKFKVKKGAFFTLMLALLAALTACNNEESFDMPGAGKLSINVGVNHSTSRSLITAATLPDGDAGAIGVMLTDGDGTITDYDAFTNVKFTGATASGSQKWTGATDVLLTENPGTLYAYYPWKDGTNLSAIAIETASQTDYLYATPVTGISETKANADVVMNHVLTNINLSFVDGTYAGVGNITSVSVSGDGIATGGTFNAAQETPGFVADSYTGVGDAITNTTATTLGGNAIDIMVVSNDAEKPITITATIDDVEYTATTTAVELAKGNSYQYTLTLNSTFLSVSKVTVTPWNNVVKDNLTLEKETAKVGPTIDATGKADGVYIVTVSGELVDKSIVDQTAIGVAVVAGDSKFLIEKSEIYNEDNNTFYWGYNLYDNNITGIENNETVDGNYGGGYVTGNYVPSLSSNYNDWKLGALAEFNLKGKLNTKSIINAYEEASIEMHTQDMCAALDNFNKGVFGDNQGYNDWYIPAAGQMGIMLVYFYEINEALENIGGTTLASDIYLSSSNYDNKSAWTVNFNNGYVERFNYKNQDFHMRMVRDIHNYSEVIGTIDLKTASNGVYAVAKNGLGVAVENADKNCIGVALIVNDAPVPQRIMISNYEQQRNDGGTTYHWSNITTDIQSITNYINADGTTNDGQLEIDLSSNYKTWTAGALSDFDGQKNTEECLSNFSGGISTAVTNFNSNSIRNQGYNDWYVPSLGQLALISLYRDKINIGLSLLGSNLSNGLFWSSSEGGEDVAWALYFGDNSSVVYKSDSRTSESVQIRYIRDL